MTNAVVTIGVTPAGISFSREVGEGGIPLEADEEVHSGCQSRPTLAPEQLSRARSSGVAPRSLLGDAPDMSGDTPAMPDDAQNMSWFREGPALFSMGAAARLVNQGFPKQEIEHDREATAMKPCRELGMRVQNDRTDYAKCGGK